MKSIEDVISISDYVNEEYPLSWMQTFDKLKASERKNPSIEYSEVCKIASSFGVESDAEVPQMLSFLHDMGMLMWFDEDLLRDVVILDPMSYFVVPATLVVCNHTKTKVYEVDRDHHEQIHKDMEIGRLHNDFQRMKTRGEVSQDLMEGLLGNKRPADWELVLKLMIKYGLVSRFCTRNRDQDIDDQAVLQYPNESLSRLAPASVKYLVPSLLPQYQSLEEASRNGNQSTVATTTVTTVAAQSTFYFLFTPAYFKIEGPISWKEMQTNGFLPPGLFERFICKAVNWSQLTISAFTDIQIGQIFKDVAMIRYGGLRFRMTCLKDYNCIQVDVEGESPVEICMRLNDQIQEVISECMKSLVCSPSILYKCESSSTNSGSSSSAASVFGDNYYHVPHFMKIKNFDGYYKDSNDGSGAIISGNNLKKQHEAWFRHIGYFFPFFDIFISHRWGRPDERVGLRDDKLCDALFDRLTFYKILQPENRSIFTFYDKHRIRDGTDFKSTYSEAFLKSKVIVPIFSRYLLDKMINPNENKSEDNVLVEWILCLELKKTVFPIFIGDHTDDKISDLFKMKHESIQVIDDATGLPKIKKVPDPINPSLLIDEIEMARIIDLVPPIIPEKSLKVAKDLLDSLNVSYDKDKLNPQHADCYTLKGIFDKMRSKLGLQAWDIKYENLFDVVAEKIRRTLVKAIEVEKRTDKSNYTSVPPLPKSGRSPSLSNQEEDSSHTQIPNWTIAFKLLVSSNALKGKEAELSEMIEAIGMDTADDLWHAPKEMLIQIAELLKPLKKPQFLKACGI